ncbi:outer membrane lipid asymmetry maintenance protein MlaD [Alishewanella sp. 16-MA]|uniref:Outer membrane lipid asymmetry maintenance protein MlaD n=1 Tax=Alishewanella maricola TaxID=2795740 RepID=A0ABS8BYX9_9ALTE|nr:MULTISPECIES: outer membrane lipid asymmetry maintenance protein MlaD [Gammaproteobacteria]MDP5036318.1 outer membrane lipid asymmetry maintenance protein MlaD [Alishewanella sp.]MDP5206486.1 outer membrane lipid asymmetry maintenance protein MlaD [Alishewanella sp. SMS9]MCB5225267.1 outer membrane lipid asymmetry maintenance protein MlaD [Alishewanella maricola]MCC5450843.1 outer membrane lipid asymmetry maintenance protein MlaD [Rheinheimera sp. UJ51]MCF4008484.1 outer membrane lipid asym
MTTRKIEILVGGFIVLACAAFLMLALKVADTGFGGASQTYTLYAKFDNIGGLKVRSPIKVGGVIVGRVGSIELDRVSYTPVVKLEINAEYSNFPETSSVAILTSGLLGEQYVGLLPGFVDDTVLMLGNGDTIEDTRSAIVLEELIGQFLFNRGN